MTLGTLWPELCANHSINCTQPAEHCLNYLQNDTTAVFSSSVEIDVIVSSRVVRSEHLLEFLFLVLYALKSAYAGSENRLFLPD
jgi:hypothetical protein